MLLYCTLTNDILVNCIISVQYVCTKKNKIVKKKRIENGFLWLKSKKFNLVGTSYESQPDFQKVSARLNPRWIIGSCFIHKHTYYIPVWRTYPWFSTTRVYHALKICMIEYKNTSHKSSDYKLNNPDFNIRRAILRQSVNRGDRSPDVNSCAIKGIHELVSWVEWVLSTIYWSIVDIPYRHSYGMPYGIYR